MSKEESKRPTVIFAAIRGFALARSRLRLMSRLLDGGYRVIAATADDEHARSLEREGVALEAVAFARGGLSPLRDWSAYSRLCSIYQAYSPDLIHQFQVKPMILGCAAARRVPRARVVNTVTGLGHAFAEGGLPRLLAGLGYRLFLKRSVATVFQNPDDLRLFEQKGWGRTSTGRLIVSSGVDTARYCPRSTGHREGPPRILMVSRLLWRKGVREFIQAAAICRGRFPEARFQLAGELDLEHPDAVPEEWLERETANSQIEFLGYLGDMDKALPEVDVVVLPSYYPEGVPRVLLEASACGVPVVTTDTPGCREAVLDGVTGRLVPPMDSEALAEAIQGLLSDPRARYSMGQAGRRRAEQEFDIGVVTEKYLDVYRAVGIDI